MKRDYDLSYLIDLSKLFVIIISGFHLLYTVDDADTPNKTLAESAAAHQAKLARPELQEVEVKTGEENESNVFQVRLELRLVHTEHISISVREKWVT